MPTAASAVYGAPASEVVATPPGALQLSPLFVGSHRIEDLAPASLTGCVIAAPPGTLERNFVFAHALRSLQAGGELIASAPKAKGGARIGGELARLGCEVEETSRRHHRICVCHRPEKTAELAGAITAGDLQWLSTLGLWSQPGVFSWDRLDPGSALLAYHVRGLTGAGADLGCGVGVLAREALTSTGVVQMALVDQDRRALDAARRNLDDPRATFLHGDARRFDQPMGELDFVIMNPPFHNNGVEDRELGAAFIASAARLLRKGGICRLVANVALPYEDALARDFARTKLLARAGGFKVLEGQR